MVDVVMGGPPGSDTTQESVWRRSMLLTMVREDDGRSLVLVQGDNAMAPLRLRHGDSCCLVMNFDVGGVKVPQTRVWVTTVNPDRWRWPPAVRRPYYRARRWLRALWGAVT